MNPVWRQLELSLAISLLSTLLAALFALPLAAALARRHFVGKSFFEALLFVPLVLPPTVVGFVLLQFFGINGPIGGWLMRQFSYTLVFSIPLAVIADFVICFPLVYLPAKAGFAGIDRAYLDLARILGASRWTKFWHILLPLARRPIVSGLLLAVARALGEFGATNMVFGWRPGNTTLPIAVYTGYEHGEISEALPAVIALLVLSVGIALLFNLTPLARPESQH